MTATKEQSSIEKALAFSITEEAYQARIAVMRRFLLTQYKKYFSRSDIEDIAQDIMIKAWRSRNNFIYEDETSLDRWLYGIAKHTAIDHLRKKNRRISTCQLSVEWIPANDPGVESTVEAKRILDSVSSSPSAMTDTFLALHFFGYSLNEYAEETGHSVPKLKYESRTAAKNIRKQLNLADPALDTPEAA